MKLLAINVIKIFEECLFKENEVINGQTPQNARITKGITMDVGFNSERLSKHSDDIYDMLKELPKDFQKDKGGGWSFLQACVDRDGKQWTGEHKVMEQLFLLGLAIDKVKYCMEDREFWQSFPGGMPYITIL